MAPSLVPVFHLRIAHAFRQRRTEWVAAIQCALWGVVLLAPANTFDGAAFSVFRSILAEELWGALLLLAGAVRLVGLIINGARKKITPWMRLGGAFVGWGIFTMISLCFASSGVISTWIAAWPVLAVVELMNISDTARDARLAHEQ